MMDGKLPYEQKHHSNHRERAGARHRNCERTNNMNITRQKLLRSSIGWGILAGLFGNKRSLLNASQTGTGTRPGSPPRDGSQVDDWHAELTKRIAALEARGGGTLELGDGVYEIAKPLRLPVSVSLVMKPYAVIRARPGFQGDAVIIKGGGKY
jgi:hypothetical protein